MTDGIVVPFADGWVHVRASQTESMIRVIAEAATPARARDLADWARDRLGLGARASGWRLRLVAVPCRRSVLPLAPSPDSSDRRAIDMRAIPTLKISISGVRGVIGDSLTPALLTRFAQAFGTYVGSGTRRRRPRHAHVGRDGAAGRRGGPALERLPHRRRGRVPDADRAACSCATGAPAAASPSPPATTRPSGTR